jgi:hypothetical protein
MMRMTSEGRIDESGQEPKRAVAIAVAVAGPLKIQPGIHMLKVPPPDRPAARVTQL